MNWSTRMQIKSKSFTLIETAVVVLSITVLLTITFSLFSFQKGFWLLRQKSFGFGKDLNRVRELAFQGRSDGGQKICGVGLLIDQIKNQYLGIAYRAVNSSVVDCSNPTVVPNSQFNLLIGSLDPESDPAIYKITKFFSFTTGNSNLLKEVWAKVAVEIKCNKSGVACPGLTNPLSFDLFEVMFKNPYAEPLVFYKKAGSSQEITAANWDNIIFTLKYKNDTPVDIILTKTGQIVFK